MATTVDVSQAKGERSYAATCHCKARLEVDALHLHELREARRPLGLLQAGGRQDRLRRAQRHISMGLEARQVQFLHPVRQLDLQ